METKQKNGMKHRNRTLELIGSAVFASRWLQAPLYFGLIVAQGVYVYHFGVELMHLVQKTQSINETEIMLIVLGLIDVVMIANLMLMVIVGGYETFVSRLYLEDNPDQPEWLEHVNAGTMKVKLGEAALQGIDKDEATIVAYHDDITIIGLHDAVMKAYSQLNAILPSFHLKLNASKS